MDCSALVFLPVIYFGVVSALNIIALHSSPVRSCFQRLDVFPFTNYIICHCGMTSTAFGVCMHTTIFFMHITSVIMFWRVRVGPGRAVQRSLHHMELLLELQSGLRDFGQPSTSGPSRGGDRTDTVIAGSDSHTIFWTLCLLAPRVDCRRRPHHFLPPFSHCRLLVPEGDRTYLRSLLLSVESITTRETMLRLLLGTHRIFVAHLLLKSVHYLLTIFLFALLRMDEIEAWPPLFGNLTRLCSVSSF